MKSMEFYITPKGDVMLHSGNEVRQLQLTDRQFISAMFEMTNNLYPGAISALCRIFEKLIPIPALFEFHVVRRFIKCNWGEYDSIMDIDQFGNLNFEEVRCHLRGECPVEGIVCKPRFNSELSVRELEIMKLFYNNFSTGEIAEKLCISAETVRTHKRNAFSRVKVHSLPEFFCYAKKHNLFKN